MGMLNSQQPPVSFNNPNTQLNNGSYVGGVAGRPIANPAFGFANAPNQHFAVPSGMNSILMAPSQPPAGQFFPQNSLNQPQYFNQGVNMQTGQFFVQNPMQHMNQFLPMQVPNYPSFVPGCLNQVPQGICSQSPIFVSNPQLGMVHLNGMVQPGNQNQQMMIQSAVDVNGVKHMPNAVVGTQGGLPIPHAANSVEQQKHQNSSQTFFPGKSQGNLQKNDGFNKFTGRKNFVNSDESNSRAMKSQFRHGKNMNRHFKFNNDHGGKGCKTDGAGNSSLTKSTTGHIPSGKKRSLPLNYTEQEVQNWREARRKNYPSKANMEKKLGEKLTEHVATNDEARLRRVQMKEILAKQAELGVEVAEVPMHLLSDPVNKIPGIGRNENHLNKQHRFQNKFNKRGRFQQRDRFAKRQRSAYEDSVNNNVENHQSAEKETIPSIELRNQATSTKKPTLLQKLLSADIKKEKHHLLQVFRFMVMNSFFKDEPGKPLKFPSVVVNETGSDIDPVEVKPILNKVAAGTFQATNQRIVEISKEKDINTFEDHNVDETGSVIEEVEGFGQEEGEIID